MVYSSLNIYIQSGSIQTSKNYPFYKNEIKAKGEVENLEENPKLFFNLSANNNFNYMLQIHVIFTIFNLYNIDFGSMLTTIMKPMIRGLQFNPFRFSTHKLLNCSRYFLYGGTIFYYFTSFRAVRCEEKKPKKKFTIKQLSFPQNYGEMKKNFFKKVLQIFSHTIRFFHLLLIFLPVIVLYPLKSWKRTEEFWLDCFVKAIERAGVVWIKAFQYMSHRRDIIGIQMAEKFVHLREHAPSHSFQQTKKNFKTMHGREISEIFQEFDEKPIASGSVGQVYKAKYKGKKVAVKVRHPGIDKYIERDINLLFSVSRFLGFFSRSFNIPITQHSMKRTMTEQVDFTIEKQNLLIFNSMFSSRHDINFPIPFQQDTNQAVLVETFAEGVPITYFQQNTHSLNSVIARLGADTFFEMLLKHNFIHADGHGGNIIVEITQKSRTFFSEIWQYLKEKFIVWEQALIQNSLETELMRDLYQQGRQQSAKVRKVLRQASDKVMITVIDVGMVITLDQTDRRNFINFIYSVLQGDGNKCAHMIFSLSKYNGKHIQMGEHKQYMTDLVNLFSIIRPNDLDNLPGVELFGGMLNLIRDYNMKLQGEFATLLTNMLVLEGMAKNIDPEINILKTAIPYFKYIKTERQIEDFQ